MVLLEIMACLSLPSHTTRRNQQKEMDTETQVRILDESACISHNTETLEKSMNPTIYPSSMGKIVK